MSIGVVARTTQSLNRFSHATSEAHDCVIVVIFFMNIAKVLEMWIRAYVFVFLIKTADCTRPFATVNFISIHDGHMRFSPTNQFQSLQLRSLEFAKNQFVILLFFCFQVSRTCGRVSITKPNRIWWFRFGFVSGISSDNSLIDRKLSQTFHYQERKLTHKVTYRGPWRE